MVTTAAGCVLVTAEDALLAVLPCGLAAGTCLLAVGLLASCTAAPCLLFVGCLAVGSLADVEGHGDRPAGALACDVEGGATACSPTWLLSEGLLT